MTRCFFQSPPLSVVPRVVAATLVTAALVFFVARSGTVDPFFTAREIGQNRKHRVYFGGPSHAHPRLKLPQESFHFVPAEQRPPGNRTMFRVSEVIRTDEFPPGKLLNPNQNVVVAHITLNDKSGVTNASFGLFPRCYEATLAFEYPGEPSDFLFRFHGYEYTLKKSGSQIISQGI